MNRSERPEWKSQSRDTERALQTVSALIRRRAEQDSWESVWFCRQEEVRAVYAELCFWIIFSLCFRLLERVIYAFNEAPESVRADESTLATCFNETANSFHSKLTNAHLVLESFASAKPLLDLQILLYYVSANTEIWFTYNLELTHLFYLLWICFSIWTKQFQMYLKCMLFI